MHGEANHSGLVDAWLDRHAAELSPDALARLFETALTALWTRTRLPLGDVTLSAIMDRVLYNAAEKFAFLSSVKIDPNGRVDCAELRARARSMSESELRDGVRFVLVEFLTVLGNLTADILTPSLHSGLLRITPAEHTEGEDRGS